MLPIDYIEKLSDEEMLMKILTNELDWQNISYYVNSLVFVKKYKNYLDWEILSSRKLPYIFYDEFSDLFNWKIVSRYAHISITFINKHYNKIDFNNICRNFVSPDIYCRYFDELYYCENFKCVFTNPSLNEQCIATFKDKYKPIHWGYISEYVKISRQFIDEFKDRLDWDILLRIHSFTFEELIKYIDYLNVSETLPYLAYILGETVLKTKFLPQVKNTNKLLLIAKKYKNSPNLLEYVNDKEVWDYISKNNQLSHYFVIYNIDKLNVKYLLQNENIGDNTREYIRRRI